MWDFFCGKILEVPSSMSPYQNDNVLKVLLTQHLNKIYTAGNLFKKEPFYSLSMGGVFVKDATGDESDNIWDSPTSSSAAALKF